MIYQLFRSRTTHQEALTAFFFNNSILQCTFSLVPGSHLHRLMILICRYYIRNIQISIFAFSPRMRDVLCWDSYENTMIRSSLRAYARASLVAASIACNDSGVKAVGFCRVWSVAHHLPRGARGAFAERSERWIRLICQFNRVTEGRSFVGIGDPGKNIDSRAGKRRNAHFKCSYAGTGNNWRLRRRFRCHRRHPYVVLLFVVIICWSWSDNPIPPTRASSAELIRRRCASRIRERPCANDTVVAACEKRRTFSNKRNKSHTKDNGKVILEVWKLLGRSIQGDPQSLLNPKIASRSICTFIDTFEIEYSMKKWDLFRKEKRTDIRRNRTYLLVILVNAVHALCPWCLTVILTSSDLTFHILKGDNRI